MLKRFSVFFIQPRYIYGLYLIVSVVTAISKYCGSDYNNYKIFKNVFYNARAATNLYAFYPEQYWDCNHYGILFSLIIAPFALLPDWLGMILWNLANVSLLIYAINCLPFSQTKKAIFAWLCLQELITALLSFQFNVALTALLILSACFIIRQKEVKSAAAILIGTFVKIYGIVGLSSFFFIRNKKKFIAAFLVLALVFFCLPMLFFGAGFTVQSYADWYIRLLEKNQANLAATSGQDISLMGVFRRIFHRPDISNLVFLAIGLPIFALPYLRIKQYSNIYFQLLIVASTLLFVVLFSSGSESPTYIIAVAGVMIWFSIQKRKTYWVYFLLFFVMLLTCFSPSDIFPAYFRRQYINTYSLKALPCIIVWLQIIVELLTVKDFDKKYALR